MKILIGLLFFVPALAMAQSQLDSENVLGFEIIIAKGCDTGLSCGFGHSFLRVLDKDNNPYNDFSIGYGTPTEGLNNFAGQLSAFTGRELSVDTGEFKRFLGYYLGPERGVDPVITRLPLQLSDKVKRGFLDILKSHISGNALDNVEYTLLQNNCAGLIAKALQNLGVSIESVGAYIPREIPDIFLRAGVANYPGTMINSRDKDQHMFDKLPQNFYNFCSDKNCAQNVLTQYKNLKTQGLFNADEKLTISLKDIGTRDFSTIVKTHNSLMLSVVQPAPESFLDLFASPVVPYKTID